jgi:cysteinyl-tRNA synthetase
VAEKQKALQGFQEFLRAVDRLRAETGHAAPPPPAPPSSHPAEEAFRAAMDDDFNTARATGVLFDLVREGNRLLHDARQAAGSAAATIAAVEEIAALLKRLGAVLTLDLSGAAAAVSTAAAVAVTRSVGDALVDLGRLLAAVAPHAADLGAELARVVQELLALREAARKNKAWAEADRIRQALGAHGIRVDDTRTACHAVSEFPAERGLPTVNVSLVKG